MAKPRKGVVPPQLRKYLFKRRAHGGAKVAKRKYAGIRRAARRVYAGARRAYRRVGKSAGRTQMTLLSIGFSFGYGAARGWLTGIDLVQQGINMIPWGGAYKSNIFFGGIAALISYFLKPTNALVKLALTTVAHSEAFMAGQKLSALGLDSVTSTTGSGSNAATNGWV